ncbi:hypothetical protein HK096_001781, partial [Nowakowskiella sp. JEL0078]
MRYSACISSIFVFAKIPEVWFLTEQFEEERGFDYLRAHDREELHRIFTHIPMSLEHRQKLICVFTIIGELYFSTGYIGRSRQCFTTTNLGDLIFNFPGYTFIEVPFYSGSVVNPSHRMSNTEKAIESLLASQKRQLQGRSPGPKAFKEFLSEPYTR